MIVRAVRTHTNTCSSDGVKCCADLCREGKQEEKHGQNSMMQSAVYARSPCRVCVHRKGRRRYAEMHASKGEKVTQTVKSTLHADSKEQEPLDCPVL
jgi:hypothetical protein